MEKRRVAVRSVRWTLLAACLAVLAGIGWLFWDDASDGSATREAERVESAREQADEPTPGAGTTPSVPLN